ncbi:PepSY domain-containing protein [Cypionkella sp.]|uniref:PepSY-associated TM helix domain-containing protein n=1 Tax=Cypionkella sp. TaxID=2811411 RepID=UPI0026235E70|nr:PepSY domain-containing protein [Cypionkella sp.]MDB5665965.1 rane protein [Cypionkella sp.]
MSSTTTTPPAGINKLYFAVWRWHFYAGLYVLPFLIMLAVTGIVMVWFTAIAPEYGERLVVTRQAESLSISDQASAALATHPAGKIGQYIAPHDAQTPAIFRVDLADGQRMIAVDPYTGAVLRDTQNGATWYTLANEVHGTLLIGTLGDRLVEIAASLGLLLVITGLYLVWPRNGSGMRALLLPDLRAKGRAWWKSMHSVMGFWISLGLVFFLISGLAWSGIWGEKYVQAWATFPAAKWDNVPLSDKRHKDMNMTADDTVPWGLEQTPMPMSGSDMGVTGLPMGVPVSLENIVALGRAIGFQGRFQVALPADEAGVWTLSRDSNSYDGPDPTADRTVHIDQFTGKILAQVGFADYGLAAKSMAVGIALHEGQLGLWNVVLNIGFCLIVVFVCVSGVVMWWKRRPSGAFRLAAPPMPIGVPLRGIAVIALLLSVAFPMLGLTLIAVLLLDFLVLQNVPAMKRAFS